MQEEDNMMAGYCLISTGSIDGSTIDNTTTTGTTCVLSHNLTQEDLQEANHVRLETGSPKS